MTTLSLFPWGCRLGDRIHDREVVDSIGRGKDGKARYRVTCRSCEQTVTVTAEQFANLGPCCRKRRTVKAKTAA